MKKRGRLIIAVFLLLAFSTLAVLSTSSSPIIPPNLLQYNSQNSQTFIKSYTGNGNPLNALLYITNNYNNTWNETNTNQNIHIPCPESWKIIWANLTLSNITVSNTTVVSNNSIPDHNLDLSTRHAMSFQLTSDAYLDYISVQLYVQPPAGTANFYFYNAVDNGSGVPEPQNQIKSVTDVDLERDTNWIDVDFGHQFLNTSDTYNDTFFIVVQKTSSKNVDWKATTDSSPPGAGYAYYYNGSAWLSEDYDCQLVVNVVEIVFPSDVGLNINGSMVSDTGEGGVWISNTQTPVSSGYILYDVDSSWTDPVSFSYIWNVTYAKNSTGAATNFVVDSGGNSFWNATVNATGNNGFPPTTTGINYINITGFPTEWEGASSKVFNGSHWFDLISHPPGTISFVAGNGTWTVNCTAPNHIANIGFEIRGVPVANATLDDNLNITVTFDGLVSGTANLSIYDPSHVLNYTSVKTVNNAASVLFTWSIGDNANSTGNYSVTASFNGSLIVGYSNVTFEIVPLKPTVLAVVSYPSYVEYPNTVPITLFYSDAGTGQGLAGAVVTAYEGSEVLTIYGFTDHGNGTYSFILDFGTDFGVHDVHFSAKLLQYDSSLSDPLSINYKQAMFVTINPLQAGLVSVMYSAMNQQNQTLISYFLIAALLGLLTSAAYGTNKWRRRLVVPDKALASLENIIVDHAPTGATLWAFDFLKMETDVTLVSGFMSAVKSFIQEMYKGGLRKLETEFVTFLREDGELLTVTCITSGNTPEEEKWIRKSLRQFIFDAEQQHWDALQNWRGNASVFRASLLEILSVVIDLARAEKVQMDRVSKIKSKRDMLQSELNRLDYQMENLGRQLETGEISDEEFEVRRAEIEQRYLKIQGDYIDTSLYLSKIPSTLEAKLVTPNSKKTQKMQKRLLKIRMEIEELRKKEREGKITTRDIKRRKKLQKELMALIEKPEKLHENKD